jgi:hypothetical protein
VDRRVQQIVRRGKHGSVRARRAMIIMASASGTLVSAIGWLWSLRKLAGYLAGRGWPVHVPCGRHPRLLIAR